MTASTASANAMSVAVGTAQPRRSPSSISWATVKTMAGTATPQAAATIVGGALVTYVASFAGWFATDRGYDRQWAWTNPAPAGWGWVPGPLRSLWQYHKEILDFHNHLTSPHQYQSNPWAWLVQARPTSFFYETKTTGQEGCTVEKCSKAISSLGTISIWWVAAAGIVVLLWYWVGRRDWRAGAILAGYAGGYLPWFLIQHRTIYQFYSIAFQPFVVLTAVFVLALVLGPKDASETRRHVGIVLVGAYCLATLMLFAFYWPIYTAQVIPYDHWRYRMWLPSWV